MKKLERKFINYFYDTEEEYKAIKPYLMFVFAMFVVTVIVSIMPI